MAVSDGSFDLTEEDRLVVERGVVHIPESFSRIPLKALNEKSKHEICLHLNPEDTILGNDWSAVAEQVGCRPVEIENMRRKESPMRAVITEALQRSLSLLQFLCIITAIERKDVLLECQVCINRDVDKYKDSVQDSEVTTTWKPLTIGDQQNGTPEYFDAFVSCDMQDGPFLETLIEKLEHEYDFKLCIVERDLLPGIDQSEAMSELIEKRCRRVILVLSQSYSTSNRNMLNWQLSFAFSLAATAQINKLVPILIENEYIPPAILKPFHIPDYTNKAFRHWFWDRVVNTLRSDLKSGSGYEGPPGPLGAPRVPQSTRALDRAPRSNTDSNRYDTSDKYGSIPQTGDMTYANRGRSLSSSFEMDKQPSSSSSMSSSPSMKTSGLKRFFKTK